MSALPIFLKHNSISVRLLTTNREHELGSGKRKDAEKFKCMLRTDRTAKKIKGMLTKGRNVKKIKGIME